MIKEAIVKIVNKEDLTYDEAYAVMNEIMAVRQHQPRTQLFLQLFPQKVQRLRQQTKSQAVRQP